MVKLILIILTAATCEISFAKSSSIDFSENSNAPKTISHNQLRDQFRLKGEIFVSNGSGALLYQSNETRAWGFGQKGDLISNWSYKAPGIKDIAFRHVWKINPDGTLSVSIKQFASMKRKGSSREVITGPLIREDNFIVKDFSSINWVTQSDSSLRVAIRLTPSLKSESVEMDYRGLPLSLDNPVIFDNAGSLWAQGGSIDAKYISMKTHKGTFAISFSPFKGAKKIGTAEGKNIILNLSQTKKLHIKSESQVIPSGRKANLYGFIDTSKKSERLNSLHSSSSDEEKQFLKHLY